MLRLSVLLLVVLVCVLETALSFSARRAGRYAFGRHSSSALQEQARPPLVVVLFGSNMNPDDFADEEERMFAAAESEVEYTGSVDWDAEWKKVVDNKNQPAERPGKEFYKSEAEIAAIRAANKATKSVEDAASNLPSMPSFDSLKGDWKFWIGVLAAISIGASLLSAASGGGDPSPTIASPDSYFV